MNDPILEHQNQLALALVQVLLGAITPNMRAISFEYRPPTMHVYVILERESESDREEASEIPAEIEALQTQPLDVEVHVSVSADPWPSGTSSVPGRPVYVRAAM